MGFINPQLYAAVQTENFNEITLGNNGAFSAGPGWNPACGLGSPKMCIRDRLADSANLDPRQGRAALSGAIQTAQISIVSPE